MLILSTFNYGNFILLLITKIKKINNGLGLKLKKLKSVIKSDKSKFKKILVKDSIKLRLKKYCLKVFKG